MEASRISGMSLQRFASRQEPMDQTWDPMNVPRPVPFSFKPRKDGYMSLKVPYRSSLGAGCRCMAGQVRDSPHHPQGGHPVNQVGSVNNREEARLLHKSLLTLAALRYVAAGTDETASDTARALGVRWGLNRRCIGMGGLRADKRVKKRPIVRARGPFI